MTVKNLYKNEDEEKPLKLADTSSGYTPEKPAGFDDSAYQAKKPTYASSYDDRIDSLLDSLENRPEFRYDAESDPLYRQYESQYRREGQRAADDTLASAAVHAGGMNSYAVTAAQQAGDYYNAKLMEALPELTQLAYEMYQADYDQDVNALKLLQDREAEDYNRYQDALTDWYAELESAYQQYRDSVADSKWQQDFDYEKEQDALAYQKWLEQFNYGKEQDAIDNRYRQDAFDYGKEQDTIDNRYRQDAFDYEKEQDAIDNQYRQDVFDYEKEQDAIDNQYRQDAFDYEKEQDAIDNQYRQDVFEYGKTQDAVDNAYRQETNDSGKEQDTSVYEKWLAAYLAQQGSSSGQQSQHPAEKEAVGETASSKHPAASGSTDYYQEAIFAAARGDRAAAEAALQKRAEKMSSSDYHGTGGGTSMAEAQRYINGLLEVSEDVDIPEAAATEMKSKSEWKESRAAGIGPEAEYATYEDYVSDYLRYLMEESV